MNLMVLIIHIAIKNEPTVSLIESDHGYTSFYFSENCKYGREL